MNWSFSLFVALMRKMIKPTGQGSFMIDPNWAPDEIQPSFSQNARSFIKAQSIGDRRFFYFGLFSLSHSNWDTTGRGMFAPQLSAMGATSSAIEHRPTNKMNPIAFRSNAPSTGKVFA
jgi:hypothetical protein